MAISARSAAHTATARDSATTAVSARIGEARGAAYFTALVTAVSGGGAAARIGTWISGNFG